MSQTITIDLVVETDDEGGVGVGLFDWARLAYQTCRRCPDRRTCCSQGSNCCNNNPNVERMYVTLRLTIDASGRATEVDNVTLVLGDEAEELRAPPFE